MPYSWNQLRFDVPEGLIDQTVVTFVDDVEQPSFTVQVTSDEKAGQAFTAWVGLQLEDLARSLPGYASVGRKDEAGRVVVEHRARSPQGQAMRQRQAYIDAGPSFAIVTLTCADKPHPKADEAFDRIAKSVSVRA